MVTIWQMILTLVVHLELIYAIVPDNTNIFIIGFADDGTILISGPDPNTLVNFAQQALNKISQWGTTHGLQFSPAKTFVLWG